MTDEKRSECAKFSAFRISIANFRRMNEWMQFALRGKMVERGIYSLIGCSNDVVDDGFVFWVVEHSLIRLN